jgi:hypothetical protein
MTQDLTPLFSRINSRIEAEYDIDLFKDGIVIALGCYP